MNALAQEQFIAKVNQRQMLRSLYPETPKPKAEPIKRQRLEKHLTIDSQILDHIETHPNTTTADIARYFNRGGVKGRAWANNRLRRLVMAFRILQTGHGKYSKY